MLCDVCLHRTFGIGNFHGQQEDIARAENFDPHSVSPAEIWDSARASAATPVPCTPMPAVVSTCDGAFDRIVGQGQAIEADDGDAELIEEENSAPRTPKRQVDPQAAASTSTSPIKHARQESEPTNGDLMTFLQTMQRQQAAALQGLTERIQGTETKLTDMQIQTAAKFENIEAQLNEVRTEARKNSNDDRMAKLEKNMADKMQKRSVRLDEYAARPAAPPTSAAPSTLSFDDTVVIIGGFPQETPRLALEAAWTNDLQNLIAAHIYVTNIRVEASYVLSSSLQARCSSSLQARSLVNVVRRLEPQITFNNATIQIYATVKKPKAIR